MTLRQRMRKARAAYSKRRSSSNLRRYLTLKARLGIFDRRMCAYFGVDPRVNKGCRKAICRAYAAGLVPTSTRGGRHAAGSYHYDGRGVDIGCRNPSDPKQQQALVVFHRKEFWRATHGKTRPMELIGPINDKIILRGRVTSLGEGADLEQAHDNHVHEAY